MKAKVIYRDRNRIPYYVFKMTKNPDLKKDGYFWIEFYKSAVVCPVRQVYYLENRKLFAEDELEACFALENTKDFLDFILFFDSLLNKEFLYENFLFLFLIWRPWYNPYFGVRFNVTK